MEAASFRPPARRLGTHLVLGGLAGTVVGLVCAIPPGLGAVFGAVAAGIALAARHAAGLRVVGDERGLRVLRGPVALDAPWSELRLGFGIAERGDGMAQRYAIFADASGRSFAFADAPPGTVCRPVQGADGRPVEVVGLPDAPLLLGLIVQRVPAWHVFPEALRVEPAEAAVAEAAKALPAPQRGERRAKVGGGGSSPSSGPRWRPRSGRSAPGR